MSDFDWEDEAVRSTLIEAIGLEPKLILRHCHNGERLTLPVSGNIAVAFK